MSDYRSDISTCSIISLCFFLTCDFIVAGLVELPHVELQANDSKHEDGHEQQQADLQQGNHGLHDGLEHHLQAWGTIAHTATTIQGLWMVK